MNDAKLKPIALNETLNDTNRLLCLVADIMLDCFCDRIDNKETLQDRCNEVSDQRMKCFSRGCEDDRETVRKLHVVPVERFKPHDFNKDQIEASTAICELAEDLESEIMCDCKASRERGIAITKLEECVMWANRCLAFYGVQDDSSNGGVDDD